MSIFRATLHLHVYARWYLRIKFKVTIKTTGRSYLKVKVIRFRNGILKHFAKPLTLKQALGRTYSMSLFKKISSVSKKKKTANGESLNLNESLNLRLSSPCFLILESVHNAKLTCSNNLSN